jgi:hypothetical protein
MLRACEGKSAPFLFEDANFTTYAEIKGKTAIGKLFLELIFTSDASAISILRT